MAHLGKYWPIEQRMRFYSGDDQWPFWMPAVGLMSVAAWAGSVASPGVITEAPATLYGWSPGDTQIEFRTANIGVGAETVQIGWQRRVATTAPVNQTIFQVWVDDVEQMGWSVNWTAIVIWSFDGPAFPAAGKLPGAVLWPTLGFGVQAQVWP
jgi:hypothetical protein